MDNIDLINTYKHDIIVAFITVIITGSIPFIVKKTKYFFGNLLEKYRINKQKKYEMNREKDIKQKQYAIINIQIEDIIKKYEDFNKHWKSKKPRWKERQKFLKDYITTLENVNLTNKQRNKLLSIKDNIVLLYNKLMDSNNSSKQERKVYPILLEKIKNYENDMNGSYNNYFDVNYKDD